MLKACLTIACIFALTSRAFAQQNWANKIFGGSPETPIVVDFGEVPRGTQMEKSLVITNIYKVPLSIIELRAGMGACSAVVYKLVDGKKVRLFPEGPALQPNETAFLDIRMDGARWASGRKDVAVFVTFGPHFVSSAYIAVSATLRRDVVVNPGEIDFGSLQRGFFVERSLDVECAGKPNWKVESVAKSDDAPFDIESEVLPKRTVNGCDVLGYRLTAKIKRNASVGPFRHTVELTTNDERQPKISFVVHGTVSPPILVAPMAP